METGSDAVIIGGNLSRTVKVRLLADVGIDGAGGVEGEVWELSRVDAHDLMVAGQAERLFEAGDPPELRLPGMHVLIPTKWDPKPRRLQAAPPGSRKPRKVVNLEGLLIGHVLPSSGRF